MNTQEIFVLQPEWILVLTFSAWTFLCSWGNEEALSVDWESEKNQNIIMTSAVQTRPTIRIMCTYIQTGYFLEAQQSYACVHILFTFHLF